MGQCGICGGPTLRHLQCNKIILMRCQKCGVIAQDPIPLQKTVQSWYQMFYSDRGTRFSPFAELLVTFFRYRRAAFVRHRSRPGRVLDVGFSRGLMLTRLKQFGWQSYGITNSPNAFRHGKSLGLHVYQGMLFGAKFHANFFQVVTFWHVLEHLRDPAAYLREAHRILSPEGVLIIEVPNIGSPTARWFGCRWLALDLPRHIFHFSPRSLRWAVEDAGFHVERMHYFSLEHSIFSLLQSMMNAVTGTQNVLLESFKYGNTIPQIQRITHALLGMLLLPIAAIGALLLGIAGRGDIMRMEARK